MTTDTETTAVEVPDDFNIDIATHPDGGIYRRYAAGMVSILDRADLAVSWSVERIQARQYQDEDLVVAFVAGDLHGPSAGWLRQVAPSGQTTWQWADDGGQPPDLRYARVTGIVAWHRTGGNNLTNQPLYVEERATVEVWPRVMGDPTSFAVRPSELAGIKARVRDVIFRDHLAAVSQVEMEKEMGR